MAQDCDHIPHETLPSCKRCGVSLLVGPPAPAPAPVAAEPPKRFVPATERVTKKLGGK